MREHCRVPNLIPETQIGQNSEFRDDRVLCFTITNQKYEK